MDELDTITTTSDDEIFIEEGHPPESFAKRWIFGRESVGSVAFNAANSTIGIGVLLLPYVLKVTGIALGIGMLFIAAFFALITLILIYKSFVKAKEIDPKVTDYEDIGNLCYGKVFGMVMQLTVVVINFGSCISYLVILFDLLFPVMNQLFQVKENVWNTIWVMAIPAIPAIVISIPRKIASLRFFSTVSLLAIFSFMLSVIIAFLSGVTIKKRSGKLKVVDVSPNILSVLGIVVFAYACHTNVVPICREFSKPSYHRIPKGFVVSTATCVVTYLVIATFGYVSFYDNTCGNLVLSYPRKGAAVIVLRILIATAIFLTYPFASYPCRISLNNVFKDIFHAIRWIITLGRPRKQEILDQPDEIKPKIAKWKRLTQLLLIFETILIGLIAFWIAVLYPKVDKIFGLVGSTGSTAASYVFPIMLYLKLYKPKFLSFQTFFLLMIMISGIILGTLVTGYSIYDIIQNPSENPICKRD